MAMMKDYYFEVPYIEYGRCRYVVHANDFDEARKRLLNDDGDYIDDIDDYWEREYWYQDAEFDSVDEHENELYEEWRERNAECTEE